MNERVVAAGVVAFVLTGIVGLFFMTHEQREVTVDTPRSEDARRNPLLAAQRLLSERGYSVTTPDQFAPSIALPPDGATAIMSSSYRWMEEHDLDALLDWVAAGGHLVVAIEQSPRDDVDPIFAPLGVAAHVRGAADKRTAKNTRDGVDTAQAAPGTEPPSAQQADRDAWGDVGRDNRVSIDLGDAQPIRTVFDQYGVFAAELRYNGGRITAVADLYIADNDLIGKYDHAFILLKLLDPAERSGPVWLIKSTEYPSLWALLTERIGVVMLAGAATLLLSLWWASQRFGPLIAPPSTARKAFIEHIEAAGRFLWGQQRDAGLLTETRQALLGDARRRHPPLRHGDNEQHARYLSQLSGIGSGDISDALYAEPNGRSADFTHRIQTLRALWKKL